MRIFIASDHAGFVLKEWLKNQLIQKLHDDDQIIDCGCTSEESVDYPDFADNLTAKIQSPTDRGILICGSGIGISIAANRKKHIRCALIHDQNTATLARQHNDANVIAFGARIISPEIALESVECFLTSPFAKDQSRHAIRVQKLSL